MSKKTIYVCDTCGEVIDNLFNPTWIFIKGQGNGELFISGPEALAELKRIDFCSYDCLTKYKHFVSPKS